MSRHPDDDDDDDDTYDGDLMHRLLADAEVIKMRDEIWRRLQPTIAASLRQQEQEKRPN
jgi:hypothetical protein